jgi:predicted lipoprotein with Yx(FWY)xxD motif
VDNMIMATVSDTSTTTKPNRTYGKRSLGQWVMIYLGIAIVLYGIVYFGFIRKGAGYMASTQPQSAPQTGGPPTTDMSSIVMIKADPNLGNYLSNLQGLTLYTFDNDQNGTSSCTGACAQIWPPYTPAASTGPITSEQLPTGFTMITRPDGTIQYAWKGKPLYTFTSDQKPGDISGNGVMGIWHIATP